MVVSGRCGDGGDGGGGDDGDTAAAPHRLDSELALREASAHTGLAEPGPTPPFLSFAPTHAVVYILAASV